MLLATISFYILAAICVASAVLVVSLRNPVHSVLFLILAFFNAAGMFVLLDAEFLAMILVVVYVGAVAVLFLFVVMMLNITQVTLRQGFQKYLPIGGIVCIVLLAEFIFVGFSSYSGTQVALAETVATDSMMPTLSNTQQLGLVLYEQYFLLFQCAGLILLVAMIGAISLTLRPGQSNRRQKIANQLNRDRSTTVTLVKVESGKGTHHGREKL